jgi:arsenical pump membrane protein
LTPAIAAALLRTDADPLPYLFACAFVANAASFVLPISNPANLVVFGSHLPALHVWLGAFALAAIAALLLTYLGLRFFFRGALRGHYADSVQTPALPVAARLSGVAIAIAALALIAAAALRIDVGYTALAAGAIALLVVSIRERGAAAFVARHIAWQVVPLVAGLFVVVAALDRSGTINVLRTSTRAITWEPRQRSRCAGDRRRVQSVQQSAGRAGNRFCASVDACSDATRTRSASGRRSWPKHLRHWISCDPAVVDRAAP